MSRLPLRLRSRSGILTAQRIPTTCELPLGRVERLLRWSSRPITHALHALMPRAVSATVNFSLGLCALTDDAALAMGAFGRHRMYRAFEAIERHRPVTLCDSKGLVVIVTADVTSGHDILLAWKNAWSFKRQRLGTFFGSMKEAGAPAAAGFLKIATQAERRC